MVPAVHNGNITSLLGTSGSQALLSLRCWAADVRRTPLHAGTNAGAHAGAVRSSTGRQKQQVHCARLASGSAPATGLSCAAQATADGSAASALSKELGPAPWRINQDPVPDKPRHVRKKPNGRFQVIIQPSKALYPGSKRLHLGTHSSKREAAEVADAALVALGKPPANFQSADYSEHPLVQRLQPLSQGSAGFEELKAAAQQVLGIKGNDKQAACSTSYIGVKLAGNRFEANIKLDDVSYWLGTHDSAEDAARVRDRVEARLRGSSAVLNFPGECPEVQSGLEEVLSRTDLQGRQLLEACKQACNDKFKSTCSSTFKGVSWYKDNGHWCVKIGLDKTRLHLGYYSSEVEAACAYDRAVLWRRRLGLTKLRGLYDQTNLPEHEYEGDVLLAEAQQRILGMHEFAVLCRERAKALRKEEVEMEVVV